VTDGRTLINVGFGYDEEGGYFVEERDGKAVAMFAERFDADAYVTMCSDLAATTARAEAAEAERDELRSALSDEIGHKDVIYVGFTVTKARLEAAEARLSELEGQLRLLPWYDLSKALVFLTDADDAAVNAFRSLAKAGGYVYEASR